MKQDKLTPARLIFSEEERKTDGLQKPISQVKKAEQQVDRIRRRLYKANHPEFQAEVSKLSAPQDRKAFDNILRAGIPERKTAASTADIPQRLIVEESLIGKVPKKHDSLIGQTMKAELHREISKAEEDSTGLQAAHTLERSGETALHTADQGKLIGQKHRLHQTEQAVKRLDHANVRFLQAKHEMEHPKPAGNPFARSYQRRMIQKEYAMAKAGKATGRTAASRSAQKAVRKGEKAAGSFLKKKGTWLLLGLVGLLVVVMNMMSSCTPLLEAALQAIVMGTYPAEEADVKAAERAYRNMEKELEREMEDYERYHPGHDEYIVDADEIWHDPYALIALISAYHGGEEWTIDSAYPTIEMLFEWQYVVEESVTTQTRYRQEGEEQIPYTYSICTVTMKTKTCLMRPFTLCPVKRWVCTLCTCPRLAICQGCSQAHMPPPSKTHWNMMCLRNCWMLIPSLRCWWRKPTSGWATPMYGAVMIPKHPLTVPASFHGCSPAPASTTSGIWARQLFMGTAIPLLHTKPNPAI